MARNSIDEEDVRSFDRLDSELPPLPSDDDDSFLRPPSDSADNSHISSDGGSAIGEREMQRQLMDIESSFLPDADADAGEAAQTSAGADDTYMFGASSLRPPPRNGTRHDSSSREPSSQRSVHAEEVALPESPSTPADAYKTPGPGQGRFADDDSEGHSEEGSSSFEEHAPSSPTAAAAERSQTRTTSQTREQTEPAIEVTHAENQGPDQEEDTRSLKSGRPTSSASTIKADRLEYEEHRDEARRSRLRDTLSTTTASRSLSNASSVRKRPSFLRDRSRGASQRSTASASSFGGRSDFSGDNRDTSDFGLQTGGALPSSGMRGSDRDLSRLPSFGSIASSFSGKSESRPPFDRSRSTLSAASQAEMNLERLDEEPRATSASPPATPTARPFSSGTNGPTDTVIAKHVQNIRVPDTVAKEYREKHARSPDRPSTANFAFSSRTKHNLTLKEQNSKIDKLSKENFDLKLKIHFLDQALQNRSDEGVKDMISKNVQLQTDLATEKKENQSLRRKVRELERKLKAQEEGMAAAKEKTTSGSDDWNSDGSNGQAEMGEEITYLRECLQQTETEVERLKEENLAKEVEKRRMAEYVKTMGDRKNSEPSAGVEEAMEMWKDLLEAETARREQADEDAERLREEVRRLKAEREQSSQQTNSRNPYSMSRQSRMSHARSQSGSEGTADNRASTSGSSVTLVEQLKHENAELRRDLGAQTSMLVSRNRERERLQQEIEDLKLSARRGVGGSVAGDSIFERSISRANHHRPSSRSSAVTRPAELSEAEREDYEQKQAELRDDLASLKMTNQELEKQLNSTLDELENAEEEGRQLERERKLLIDDMQLLQADRDESANALHEKEQDFEELRNEALQEIEQLEQEMSQKDRDLDRLMNDLENRNEDFEALQQEMKSVSESLVMLEDDRNASLRRIQQLEQELDDANQELESLDQKLHEAQQKIERFEVQQESNQGEITFLREEQETDKIRIGDLEAALNGAQMNIQEEKERFKDLEDRVLEERRQREALDSQEKEQVQTAFDELNTQASKARDEVRRLRKELSAKEVEAAGWKQRLEDLETSLRDALGSLDGTKANLLKDIKTLQTDLDETIMELDHARTELADKERTLRNRDTLLESTSLESRKLADMLDKERQLRMQDKRQFEQSQRTHQSNSRTIQSYETRILELETSRSQDRRRINQLEAQYKDQLLERNNLLLALWNRLSTLCGTDWAQRNSLVNGELPTLEVIARSLPGFSKNVLAAIKMVEGILGGFKVRIRGIEKDLWKEYQTLEHKLDVRIKHLDGLEKNIRSGSMGLIRNETLNTEISRLKSENKHLKAEVNLSRQHTRSSTDSADHPHPLPNPRLPHPTPHRSVSGPQGPSTTNRNSLASTLLRHSSTTDVAHHHSSSSHHQNAPSSAPAPVQPTEQRWIHRLKELERRLKAEREARLLDRSGARKRLEEGRAENEELRVMLEREKERGLGSESGRSSPSAAAFPTIGTR